MTNELILNSNNIGVNTEKKSLTKKKKKGFTLVELIAVIAILAILAAIIVPRVASYTGKATTSRYLADARTLAGAIETYNADPDNATTQIKTDDDWTSTDVTGKLSPKYIQNVPTNSAEITAIGKTYTTLLSYISTNSK
ncbi:prepilin-type N-terminal cleavage/methylation domain-containing protein [Clostridium arbusti]|uniref:prepilin-type N-terminal cleavage/methylation domain-containing protein n=1 Tax=Clostridium arbusti TaxID=1137848 RepID=UPI000288002B|nr:prepilin-type N-terminal cleavage/methylation domain-containing protein [Clostridium arbusti]